MNRKFLQIITSASLTGLLVDGGTQIITQTLGIAELKPVMAQGKRSISVVARRSEEQTRIAVYEKASPAVVTIKHGDVLGSGFIVSPDGLVLTNAHVLEDAPATVMVILKDETEVVADVIGFQGEGLDLAALKIRDRRRLPTLRLAAPEIAKVGQSVYAIGSPFGLENSFTSGIVSRIDRKRGWIQHDAAINPGNSGGPLLNSKAEVMGINTLLINPSGNSNAGIGIAIAVDQVQPFLVALQQNDSSLVAQQPQARSSDKTSDRNLPVDGETVTATLKRGDSVLPNNTYYQVYTFEGRAGQQVTIEMNSNQIDPSLFLVSANQEKVIEQNDDISPKNFNAQLVATLPEDGIYLVVTNAFECGESGKYSIRATFK
ncbi:MAG: trypsin-like peptidase domain-containing protein [Nostoc sp. NMS1]|uniref:trypsin-like peptidase domain-containing protein n=1 Tax=Nostoc sp. NMS1 TaxID=2815388 RepID=UPI0025FBAADE|nr:trypsin-like peptidase domain-containing protein [Nostoc sp. NMS1]MBN3910669.1 trypsin-like peptidase domain-containing protein [Nostoc sp. NMS1]